MIWIARVLDGMLLAEHVNQALPNPAELRRNAKDIIRNLKATSPLRCTIDAGSYFYHYIIEKGVCYMTLLEKTYPRKLAFSMLEEVQNEFSLAHQHEVEKFSRPYAAVSFDPKLARIRRDYADPRTPRNVKRLNEDLTQIQHIMRQNIQDVLHRGERLESIQNKSSLLLIESKKMHDITKQINLQRWYRLIVPILVICLFIFAYFWWKFR